MGKKQKRGYKPFRKRWPPTPRTATATSPCLLGPIDPLIRYSQSPLLGRPPPQLAVRAGMWGSAPLRITIPVIFCYNTASHFNGGWVEMIWDGKEEEGWLIPSPSLIPPPLGCLYSCGRSHSAGEMLRFYKCDETAKNWRSRSHDMKNTLVFNWHIPSNRAQELPTFPLG